MSQLNQLLESANPYKSLQSDAARLANKWSKTGLLEGLGDETSKNNMSMLLENQAKQLVTEVSNTGGGSGAGTFTAGTGAQWAGVALPLVRKVFGQIAAKEFVSVQPMNLPSGLVFYLDFQYGTNHSPFASGNSLYGDTSANFGNTNTGGLYGAGRYGYTVSSASLDMQTLTDAGVPSYKDINFNADVSASHAGKLKKFTLAVTKAQASDMDKLAVRAWELTSGSTGVGGGIGLANNDTKLLNEFTTITGNEGDAGTLSFIVAYANTAGLAGGASNLTNFDIRYVKRNSATDRGDFEDKNGNAADTTTLPIPQIDLQLKSRAIVAKTRKLKAVWTPELAQDLNAYHSVDAEAELTSMLSEYISMEIDLEILDMLISDAVTVDYWSARQGNDFDSANNEFVNTTFYGTRFEWFQTLLAKVQKVSNEIHRLTLRGGANFLVCGPKVATVLESIPGFGVNTDGNKAQFAAGVQAIGQLQNRFQVYKSPYMTENTILMGYRGNNFLETGAVYSPYIPLIMTPLVYDPEDFTPRKGVMTRYAKKMIRPEFYGKIHVADLDLI